VEVPKREKSHKCREDATCKAVESPGKVHATAQILSSWTHLPNLSTTCLFFSGSCAGMADCSGTRLSREGSVCFGTRGSFWYCPDFRPVPEPKDIGIEAKGLANCFMHRFVVQCALVRDPYLWFFIVWFQTNCVYLILNIPRLKHPKVLMKISPLPCLWVPPRSAKCLTCCFVIRTIEGSASSEPITVIQGLCL